ncbi:hypothetical protein P12x_000578 [Tundrisphaera lichenicola]|uniref:WD40 repeat domain-containing protein n=1 Tax=Tundrisphaera lichenicola TaxID=2029860 RepID=UPI003EC04280
MAIVLTCEGCGRRVKVPDQAAGRKGKCPACDREILVPGGQAAAAPSPASRVVATADDVVRDGRADAASGSRATGALGVASLVLGCLALLISWVPLIGLLTWPLGGLGLVLGAVGLVLASGNRRSGKVWAFAGLGTNGLAVAVALVMTLLTGRALQDAASKAQLELAKGGAPVANGPAPNPTPNFPGKPVVAPADGTFEGQDRNGDGRLNADEVPESIRARFAEVDGDGNGYVEKSGWELAFPPAQGAPAGHGKLIARRIITAADDFIVDVWHNGRRVPEDKRAMVGENFGATAEKIEVEVHEGDWLVFNVANNRLRWDGACYFGAAGVNDEEPKIGFATNPGDPRWAYCDDPGQVPAFIAHPRYLAGQSALAPANPWSGGDGEMKARVPGWDGRPVWGRERTTWIKFVALPGFPPSRSAPAGPSTAAQPAPTDPVSVPAEAAPDVALKERATFTGHPALAYCVAVSPDGRKVVSGSAPNFSSGDAQAGAETLIVWDLADGGKTRGVIPIKQSVWSLAITPDGKSIIVPVDNGLSVFDLKTGRRTSALPGPPQTNAMSVAVSPDGKIAAGGFNSKQILLWNLKTGKVLRTLRGHTGVILRMAFSPDGQQLASGDSEHSVRLWDVSTGRAERTLTPEGDPSPVTCVTYTPDGSNLVTVSSARGPEFWEPGTGRRLRTIGGDEVLSFHSVAFSPDGRRMGTASFDPLKMRSAVVLWDTETGRRLGTGEGGEGQSNAVAFTPDGGTLVSTMGNDIKVWDIPPVP